MIVVLNIFIFMAVFLVQVTALPRFSIGGFQLDLILLFILLFSIYRKSYEAYVVGFLSGLLMDLIFGGPFGLHTITFMLVAFLGTIIISDQEDASLARLSIFIFSSVILFYLFSFIYILVQTKVWSLQTAIFFAGQILINSFFCILCIPIARRISGWEQSYEARHK